MLLGIFEKIDLFQQLCVAVLQIVDQCYKDCLLFPILFSTFCEKKLNDINAICISDWFYTNTNNGETGIFLYY